MAFRVQLARVRTDGSRMNALANVVAANHNDSDAGILCEVMNQPLPEFPCGVLHGGVMHRGNHCLGGETAETAVSHCAIQTSQQKLVREQLEVEFAGTSTNKPSRQAVPEEQNAVDLTGVNAFMRRWRTNQRANREPWTVNARCGRHVALWKCQTDDRLLCACARTSTLRNWRLWSRHQRLDPRHEAFSQSSRPCRREVETVCVPALVWTRVRHQILHVEASNHVRRGGGPVGQEGRELATRGDGAPSGGRGRCDRDCRDVPPVALFVQPTHVRQHVSGTCALAEVIRTRHDDHQVRVLSEVARQPLPDPASDVSDIRITHGRHHFARGESAVAGNRDVARVTRSSETVRERVAIRLESSPTVAESRRDAVPKTQDVEVFGPSRAARVC